MTNFFEIDFLEAGNNNSGDAICIRYEDFEGAQHVHVVDGGYIDDGEKIVDHIGAYYRNPSVVDHVVLTHPDADHAGGLKFVLENSQVGKLWMNRPWVHVEELNPMFECSYTRDGLIRRLRDAFPNVAELEEIANAREIPIGDPLQGAQIGAFLVLAPSKERYLELVVASEKTPEEARRVMVEGGILRRAVRFVKNVVAEWGQENLKGETEGTSSENESSVVQYAELCGKKILLTGDAGIKALEEAYHYARGLGVPLPGIDRFHVPHHGSRRNLSSGILDLWLGAKLPRKPDSPSFTAIVSANRNDPDHPRKAVVRALIHRGGQVYQTNGTLCVSEGAPKRNWPSAIPLHYPNEMEE